MANYLHDYDKSREPNKKNNAGGQSFAVDCWTRLERFLILGSEGGTYYVDQPELTKQNVQAVEDCLKQDGIKLVEIVTKFSTEGRAPKNDPALYALAMASASDDANVRKAAFEALPKVARIGTHLFHFADYMKSRRGWGRAARKAISDWYLDKDINHLANQAVKYKQRDGWSHRDLLRLAHPKTVEPARKAVFDYIVKGNVGDETPGIIKAATAAHDDDVDAKAIRELIDGYNLTREMIPTGFLNDKGVWKSLCQRMPMTAMIRNLGKISSLDLMDEVGDDFVTKLTDPDILHKARIHPLQILTALYVYGNGRGMKGDLTWKVDKQITNALDKAFYYSFPNHRGSGKRVMLSLDVSGSMTMDTLCGSPLTPRDASAALSLITAATEPNYLVTGFTCGGDNFWAAEPGGSRWSHSGIAEFPFVKPNMKLKKVINSISNLPFGGTDCALPMIYAKESGKKFDAFVVYTDSETWAGHISPVRALNDYREKTGINAKLVVVGMTSNGFSIADPNDSGMLDVVGFDTATPQIISDFIAEDTDGAGSDES